MRAAPAVPTACTAATATKALDLKRKALTHYQAALQCLSLPANSSTDDAAERAELCDELRETITAITDELNLAVSTSNKFDKPATPLVAPTTTIGFGAAASSSTTTIGTSVQVKRKAKPNTSVATQDETDASKRQKVAE